MRNPFEVINVMFTQPHMWIEVSSLEKRKNVFMINRTLSIKFPQIGMLMSNTKLNPVQVVDFWQRFIQSQFSNQRPPGWLYTKGSAKSKQEKQNSDPIKIDHKTKVLYAKYYQLEIKDIDTSIKMIGDPIINDLLEFEKIINQGEK